MSFSKTRVFMIIYFILLPILIISLLINGSVMKEDMRVLEVENIKLQQKIETQDKTINMLEKKQSILEVENRELEKNKDKIERELKAKEQKNQMQTTSRGGRIISSPQNASSFKSYMDYRTITNRSSKQYKLQQGAKTNKQGFRTYNGAIMVALGSGFGKVGDTVEIFTENGSFKAIIGDQKADKHTDKENKYHLTDKSVVEFIVDTKSLEKSIKQMGDCSYATSPNLKGKIKKIKNFS